MKRPVITVVAILAALSLAGCGSDTEHKHQLKAVSSNAFNVVKLLVKPKPKGSLPEVSPEVLAAVLRQTPGPIYLLRLEEKHVQDAVTLVAQNRSYQTFVTSDGATVTFKAGIVSGTRGIGGDLMSANVDGSLALISSRVTGSSQRVNRYLVEDDVTLAVQFTCSVTAGEHVQVSRGEVVGSGQLMSEVCQSDGASISNSYVVDRDGRILQSRQWVGADIGYVTVLPIRL